MLPAAAAPCRAAASRPHPRPLLPPRVMGAVNICTGLDKEKANRVLLFMGLGSLLPGQLHGVSVLTSPCTPRLLHGRGEGVRDVRPNRGGQGGSVCDRERESVRAGICRSK